MTATDGGSSGLAARAKPRATMAADAFGELRQAIMLGELSPGTPLRLEELARSLGMSISPVREALRLLEMQGLAEYEPYRGARVTQLSNGEMIEIYEARTSLERTIARRAALRFTETHRASLMAAVARSERGYESGDRLAVVHGNSAFHTGVAGASESQWLQRLLKPLLEMSERYAAAVLRNGEPAETREIEQRGHLAIVEALGSGDPDLAEATMAEHLRVFEEHYSAGLATTPEP